MRGVGATRFIRDVPVLTHSHAPLERSLVMTVVIAVVVTLVPLVRALTVRVASSFSQPA
jgi:hypothetical protein